MRRTDGKRHLSVSRYALFVGVAGALLAGCGGAQAPIAGPNAMPSRAIASQIDGGRSWMLTEARSADLLYVANGNGTVTTYTYPEGRLVGTLFGFDTPEGECVDSSAHGAKKPRKKLSDVGYNPTSCSIDPGTGNLAVAADPDNVAVYTDAKGSPKQYTLGGSYPYCGIR